MSTDLINLYTVRWSTCMSPSCSAFPPQDNTLAGFLLASDFRVDTFPITDLLLERVHQPFDITPLLENVRTLDEEVARHAGAYEEGPVCEITFAGYSLTAISDSQDLRRDCSVNTATFTWPQGDRTREQMISKTQHDCCHLLNKMENSNLCWTPTPERYFYKYPVRIPQSCILIADPITNAGKLWLGFPTCHSVFI